MFMPALMVGAGFFMSGRLEMMVEKKHFDNLVPTVGVYTRRL